jgi:hypothetical protein
MDTGEGKSFPFPSQNGEVTPLFGKEGRGRLSKEYVRFIKDS